MDVTLFDRRTTRNPEGQSKYLILEGARAGWVMPGNMLLTHEQGFATYLTESVLPINPIVNVGDTVLPLHMHESRVQERVVTEVDPQFIRVDGMPGIEIKEWVLLPESLPRQDKDLFFLQIREHLTLAGYEENARRRGWFDYWKDVNASAGFILRPLPSTVLVRAKWRVNRGRLDAYIQPERMQEIVSSSDAFVVAHVTTDHTVYLPSVAAECRCVEHARVHPLNQEVTSGASYQTMAEILRTGMKSRLELHSIEVRAISCPYGQAV